MPAKGEKAPAKAPAKKTTEKKKKKVRGPRRAGHVG
jgi:hypothetical protein